VNSIPSRPGLREGGSDEFELLLDARGREVLNAYAAELKIADKVQSQTLRGAKSVKFPAFWNAEVEYHVPGTEITGGQIASQDVTVSPDDKLISSVFVADIDEALFDVEVRSPYTEAIGRALAEHYDGNVARTLVLSARGGPLFTGDEGGYTLEDADLDTDAIAVMDALSGAKEEMDRKKVPVHSQRVYAALPTAQWYMVARSDRNLNRDYNSGDASIRRHTLRTIDDIDVIKSNNLNGIFGTDDSANTVIPAEYRGNFTNTRGVVWTPYAAATVVVQDLGLQMVDQPHKQGILMIGRRMVGTRPLRTKTAVELALPAA